MPDTAVTCQHDRCFESNVLLLSDPPQQRWICRVCGARGTERLLHDDRENEFEFLVRSFGGQP